MSHKANVINLQFKLLAAHIRLGGQDSCENDIGETLNEKKILIKTVIIELIRQSRAGSPKKENQQTVYL